MLSIKYRSIRGSLQLTGDGFSASVCFPEQALPRLSATFPAITFSVIPIADKDIRKSSMFMARPLENSAIFAEIRDMVCKYHSGRYPSE